MTEGPKEASPFPFATIRFTKKALITKDTAQEIATPAMTPIIELLGDSARTEKILPGEGVATVPTFRSVNVPVPAIPPAIIPMIVRGLANTYGK